MTDEIKKKTEEILPPDELIQDGEIAPPEELILPPGGSPDDEASAIVPPSDISTGEAVTHTEPSDEQRRAMDAETYRLELSDQGELSPLAEEKLARQAAMGEIDPEEQYVEQSGALMSTLEGMAYPGNAARSAILGKMRGEGAEKYGLQALRKERKTEPWQLRRELSEQMEKEHPDLAKFIYDKELSNRPLYEITGDITEDAPRFVRDVTDTAFDFVVDMATDPLGYLAGVGGMFSKVKGLKLGPQTLKATAEAGVPGAVKAYQTSKVVGAGTGGLVAIGASDKDEPAALTIGKAAAVAAALYGGGRAAGSIKTRLLKPAADASVGSVAKKITGLDEAVTLARDSETAAEAVTKMRGIMEPMVQNRLRVLAGLSKKDRARVSEIMDRKVGETVFTRELSMHGEIGTRMNAFNDRIKLLDDALTGDTLTRQVASQKLIDQGLNLTEAQMKSLIASTKRERNILWNETTEKINAQMSSPEFYKELVETEGKKVADAVFAWKDLNRAHVEKVNREIHGLATGKWDRTTGKGLEGLDFHIDNPFFKQESDLAEKAMRAAEELAAAKRSMTVDQFKAFEKAQQAKLQVRHKARRRFEGRNEGLENYTRDQTYAAYAMEEAKKFVRPEEWEAIIRSSKVNKALAEQKPTLLKAYDWLLGRQKANLLLWSTTWIKNNYPDNLLKAFVENGLGSAFRAGYRGIIGGAASMVPGAKHATGGVVKDILMMDKPGFNYLYKNPESAWMVGNGVVSKNFWNEAKELQEFMLKPSTQEALKEGEKLTGRFVGARRVGRAVATPFKWTEGRVARLGSVIEDSARATTFLDTMETLKRIGVEGDAARRIAKTVVDRTFFDYGKVHVFEQAVFKRLVPFYTFFSRNVPYWAEVASQGRGMTRIRQVDRSIRAGTRDPTEEQISGLQTHQQQNPRIYGQDDMGNLVVKSYPSNSFYDAINMLDITNPREHVGKLAPPLKMMYELMTGEDIERGMPVSPAEYKKADVYTAYRAPAGSKGYPKAWLNVEADKAGLPVALQQALGIEGYYVDPVTGKSYATDPAATIMSRVYGGMFPVPIATQAPNLYLRPKITGKKDEIQNVFMSPQIYKVSPDEAKKAKYHSRRK